MMKYMVLAVSLLAAISFNASFAEAFESVEQPEACEPHKWLGVDEQSYGAFTLDHHGHKLQAYAAPKRGDQIANVVFLHGFADTARNHRWLFRELSLSGLRVFSFDYPEHGGSANVSLNKWSMDAIAGVIPSVLRAKGADSKLPLLLVGWSTGGTLALRIAQTSRTALGEFQGQLKGVAAIAPGVPVRQGIGSLYVMNKNLTNCPGGMQDPKPRSPLAGGLPIGGSFTKSLIDASKELARKPMPADVKTLVLIAKDGDQFVDSDAAYSWSFSMNGNVASFRALQCKDGSHGLEFDLGIGKEVRGHILNFALLTIAGKNFEPKDSQDEPLCKTVK